MQAYQGSKRFKVVGDTWRFGYRANSLRVFKERVSAVSLEGAGGTQRTEYLYDGPMPVLEQDFDDGVLKQSRVNFLGARGIEAIITVDHTRNDQASLQWLFYDGHGNVVQVVFPHLLPLSRSFGRGVSRPRRGEGSCANLGHPEDETGLVYMRARYYEPATGRFISEDPSRDGVNWYLYADGNPVGKVDASGKDALTVLIGQLWVVLGTTIILLGTWFPHPSIVSQDLLAAYIAVKSMWSYFSFLLAFNIGVAQAFGGKVSFPSLAKAIINAFAATVIVAMEAGTLAALVPGRIRLGAVFFGAMMVVIGMMLMVEGRED